MGNYPGAIALSGNFPRLIAWGKFPGRVFRNGQLSRVYLMVWGGALFIVWGKFLFQVNSASNTLTTFNILVNCLLPVYFMNAFKCLFVGNKEKGRILKRVFQENKACQIFRKTNISYPLIFTRTCEYQGIRNVCISENLACFVFLKHPF